MDSSKILLLTVSLSCLIIASNAINVRPEVTNFCNGAENSTLCSDIVAPLFVDTSFDTIKALAAEIDAINNEAKKVSDVIKKALTDPSTDKKAIDALDICKSQYESILDSVKEVQKLVGHQKVSDAYYKFSAVISYQQACEDAFTESPGVQNPIAIQSHTVFQLGGNCLNVMNGIVNHNRS